ncbi:MAG: MFS transporter [Corynebacterium sp.]|uniref:MFS transporter n=1 Tax=Corynebacterium sp. TaxID=1720 RepID=UPI003F00A838
MARRAGIRDNPVVQRGTVALVQVLCLATWFSASAVVPSLQDEWGISLSASVWLTASTQVGFVVGAVVSALANLADRIPAPLLLSASAVGAAATTVAFTLIADGLAVAVPLRLLTGVFLAGVYPVGMKIMTSWSPGTRRGRSLGILIGALTLGSTLPHLIGTVDVDWRVLMAAAAGVTTAGAVLALLVLTTGPYLSSGTTVPNPHYLTTLITRRRPRLINIGYLGHMWELYALWTWFPLFAAAAVAARGAADQTLSLWTFVVIGGAGVVGCLLGGWAADRFGRRGTAAVALTVSGLCCLLSPLMYTAGPVLLTVLAAVWGASVIADSGVFSTMLSENVDGNVAGTALTAQTAAGFLVTVASIQLVGVLVPVVTWQYALVPLVVGPVAGVVAMLRFRSV